MLSRCSFRADSIAIKFQAALALLLEAAAYAEQTSGDAWEFAVEIGQLRNLGLSKNDLRFLVRLQYVDHAREVSVAGNNSRQFRPTGDLFFTDRTCFILTAAGLAALASQKLSCSISPANAAAAICLSRDSETEWAATVPFWDTQRHALTFDDKLVKEFRWRAANQETILAAFQEDGWPLRIDDPLAPTASLVSKQRLRDTIKCLNRSQANRLIHFRGDGTGQGVIWESVTVFSANGTSG